MAELRRWTAYAAVATMTASVLVFTGGSAMADPVGVPSLVDDGAYPGAAQILAEQNVEMVAGDGHVVLADCATPPVGDIGLLKVFTTDETIGADGIGRVCFKVTAAGGWLRLRVPGVYEIRGDGQRTGTGHEVTADLVSDEGEHISVDVDPDGSTQVGLGADPNASPTMLLLLRAGDGLAPVTGSTAAVGKATVGERMCTASLVAPNWVLTASTCFATDPLNPVVVDAPLTGLNGVVFPGHAMVGLNYVSPRPGRDVALARLASPITDITPLSVATSAASTGTAVTAVGYGRSGTDWVSDAQQSPPITFTASTDSTLTASSGPLVCKGMAGAPVIVNNAVAAVLSQGGQSGCYETAGATGTNVTAARTDGLATWVSATATTSPSAAHTWTMTDLPDGAGNGTPVTTVADSVHTGTAMPLAAASGVTWKTGDTYSPAVDLNGISGTLTTTQPPVNARADFGLSVRVKLDAYGGVVLSQDSNSSGNEPIYKLWAEASDHSWRFQFLADIITAAHIPVYRTAVAPPESAKLGVWQHVSVHYDRTKTMVLLKVDDVPTASIHYVCCSPKGSPFLGSNGPFRVGAVETSSGAAGSFLDGTVSAVQVASGADMPAGTVVGCQSQVKIYGITADKKLTYTLIEPYTSTVISHLTSTATFSSFTPLSMATLNDNTLLVTSTTGVLYRVDVTGTGTALTFASPVQLGTGWTLTQLTYDGSYLYGTTSAGALRRYRISAAKPALADITEWITVGSSGFTLNALTGVANQQVIGTKTSDGSLHRYIVNGANDYSDSPLGLTWTDVSHIMSPGGGLYYVRRTSGVVTLYKDANPENGLGADITTVGTVTDPAGWNQVELSARPARCTVV